MEKTLQDEKKNQQRQRRRKVQDIMQETEAVPWLDNEVCTGSQQEVRKKEVMGLHNPH